MHCQGPDMQIEPAFSRPLNGRMKDGTEPAENFVEAGSRLFNPPTAQEMSRLIDGNLRDLRVCVQQEARNDFAHLLNRGSSLE